MSIYLYLCLGAASNSFSYLVQSKSKLRIGQVAVSFGPAGLVLRTSVNPFSIEKAIYPDSVSRAFLSLFEQWKRSVPECGGVEAVWFTKVIAEKLQIDGGQWSVRLSGAR